MGMFLVLSLFGAGLALVIVGIPALLVLGWQIIKVIYALFVLIPIQIIRVSQGKPAVPKQKT